MEEEEEVEKERGGGVPRTSEGSGWGEQER